jgi:HEAT repeat protein
VIRLLGLKPGEGRPVGLAIATSFFASAGLTIGQSGIEALFFARYGVEKLPVLYLILGGTMFLVMLGFGALLGHVGRGRACIMIPLALAVVALAGRIGLAGDIPWLTPVLWLVQGVAYFVMGLAVWGLAGLVTDTRQAKRFFPLIGAGGVLGFVVGGLATKPLASTLGTSNLLLVWVGTLVAVALLGSRLLATADRSRSTARSPRLHDARPIDQLTSGFRYVRRSTLMRWLSLGAILFSLLFFSLYLPFSRAATARYPNPDDLAGFFGLFFALSTGLAFLMSLFVTNRLLARFGVPTVMLVLPVLYVATFGVLAILASFGALLVFRFAQVAWIQGGASSSWEAVVNTVPPDRRDQTRAFLYGGPTQVGTVLAGVIALVGERALSPSVLYGVGFACAVLATVAMFGVRRAYPRELVKALRQGRPNVFDATPVGAEPFGLARADQSAVSIAVAALSDPDPHVRRVAAHVLGDMPTQEAIGGLVASLQDEDAVVRATAIRSLARTGASARLPAILERSTDLDPGVRLATVEAVEAIDVPVDAGSRFVGPLLRDPDPVVRAGAAAVLVRLTKDPAGTATLLELAGADEAAVRGAAFRAMRGLEAPDLFDVAAAGLHDDTATVRADAARALAAIAPSRALDLLVAAMADDQQSVREAVAESLAAIGTPAVDPVVRSLDVPERRAGALSALERLPIDGRANDVHRFAVAAVARAVESHRLGAAIPDTHDERLGLLRDSLLARSEREARSGLRAASVLRGGDAISVALENISVTDPARRADALEVIESVGARDIVRPLVSMWDGPSERADQEAVVDRLREDPDDWIRRCADLADAQTVDQTEGGSMTQTLPTLSTMERVLFLRKVPLFAELPPPDLEPIALISEEHAFSDGETIAEQGGPGDAMHIIVSGEVAVVVADASGEHVVAMRSAGDAVGEMAVITNRPRVAGLVARGDVRVLSIGRPQFESILRERPETALGVIRVLCERLAETPTTGPQSGASGTTTASA